MTEVILKLNTDNEWFDGVMREHLVAEILVDVGDRIVNGETSGKIQDGNGNTVGSFEFNYSDTGR